ncbi:lysylphosphatidylglycerol synthase transmembrane domain-containing protein [Spirosoma sp.]|uniref:lysylphosphatidylglycerol synthase transmembrane domain-containing protein n=1 Tax=Spirosoma sp. TaxID=1899569 RepID=UPI003B3B02D4
MNKLIVRRGLPILLAVLLLIYALRGISFRAISTQFQQANYGLIVLVVLLTIISYFVRGKRWQQPLRALGYQPSTFRATLAMQTGVISSMIVMGSGELTRCATLQRTDGVPISQGIGSVVAERIIDLFMLAILLLVTMLLEFSRMQRYLTGLTFALPDTYLMVSLAAFLLFSILAIWLIMRSPSVRDHALVLKIQNIGQGFRQGFMAIQRLPQPGLFIALTILNQIIAWLGTYFLLIAVDSTKSLPPSAALTILAVSSLGGLAVPTQGGIGTYHFLVSRALVLYGLTAAEGAVAATFMHAVGFAINLLLSSLSFLIVPVLITAK